MYPVQKNARGQRIDSGQKLMIINAYKSKLESDSQKSLRTLRQELSKELGIDSTTISQTITEYKRSKMLISPNKNQWRISSKVSFEEFQKNIVRRHVHSIWLKRMVPTVDKIYQVVSNDESLPPISKTYLFRLLKEMHFKYSKQYQNSALTEKSKIVLWRRQFLEDLQKYQKEGRHLYYLDETWVNVDECTIKSSRDSILPEPKTSAVNPSGKGKRLIVLNIGSEDGFVPDALLCFESKKNTKNFQDEINGDKFYEWLESVLPRLKRNCVIIMDNASHHSVEIDKAPTLQHSSKSDIIKWLEDKNEIIDKSMIIFQLLEIVNRIKPHHKKYVIDELAKQHGCIILRIPPFHCELNPMELAWSSVKNHVRMNQTTDQLTDVKQLVIEGVERVNAVMWKDFISLTKVEEEKFWELDFIIDDVVDDVLSRQSEYTILSSDDSSIEYT